MDEKQLQEIRARVEKATPGPWIHMDGDVFYGEIRDVDNFDLIAEVPEADDRPEDFEFMAEARQDIPDLLAEVERLREEVTKFKHRYELACEVVDELSKSLEDQANE